MKSRPAAAPRFFPRSAFTLIEVLAAVAIVGVLAGILLAAVLRARDHSRLARCEAVQRQIGAALLLYVGDNRGMLPGPCYGGVRKGYSTKPSDGSFFGFLAPYLGLKADVSWRQADLAVCPAWESRVVDASQAPVYKLNDAVAVAGGETVNPWGYPGQSQPVKMIALENPASTWLLQDADQGNTSKGASWHALLPAEPVHGGGTLRVSLYGDGSVRTTKAD